MAACASEMVMSMLRCVYLFCAVLYALSRYCRDFCLILLKWELTLLSPKWDEWSIVLLTIGQRLRSKTNPPSGLTGNPSSNCQETETRTVRAWHALRQSLRNHPSGHVGKVSNAVVGRGNVGWTTSKIRRPCPCQNCSPLWDSCRKLKKTKQTNTWTLNHPSCSPTTQLVKGLNRTRLCASNTTVLSRA